ncbi:putative mannan endo-1,4-beta-mannosidase 5 [Phragmites australis]|uniref:putative mannan endo-1,4-beta-mannosidase 5 n=1 Tax=Phragmites australis TaxID=29695 RepID=UPI002D7855BC|nr:putative mannan endo-1,4-beta-mannosidase 5 [Phragmites australis]
MVATTMATIFREKTRGSGKVSLIHFLARGFAVAATIFLLADGRHAHVEYVEVPGDHTPAQGPEVPSSEAIDGQWGMVKTKGSQFVVRDRPFYVNGFNTYWLMILAVDPSTRGKVTEVFRQAAAVGLTVCRTWGFNDGGWRALQKSPSVYDEDVFKALDFVVSEARKYRIRLILSLSNNWDGYGGKAQYVKWARDAGANVTSDDDFFSDQTVKCYFKNHIMNMLTRVNTYTNVMYKDDPTIFAWELMNEPRCTSDPTGNKLQAWIQEMAFQVKSIDPGHLLEVGTEGFYGPSSSARMQTNPNTFAGKTGTDFIRNHRILGIDFASVHVYPDTWLSGATLEMQLKFVQSWMQAHIADAEGELGMPVLFTEFGVSTKARSAFNATSRDRFIQAVYGELLGSTRHGGAGAGGLLWQVFPEGTDYMDDGYGVVLPRAAATAGIMSAHSKKLQTFNSRCVWSCRWGCKKREEQSEDVDLLFNDEL